ncbi:hypothetical protein Klosneuvirus_1_66 [Klosneuvirus KNV1]|uniref:HNH endonuclease n=1 Tax=Klosneuvirus KNV1 TaxID=1977640 RepID=A0A1V0SHL0_9VIRU|nr:hypothetical protein Klosneuvirus_1_66 [Klosneuvirus KNV1]
MNTYTYEEKIEKIEKCQKLLLSYKNELDGVINKMNEQEHEYSNLVNDIKIDKYLKNHRIKIKIHKQKASVIVNGKLYHGEKMPETVVVDGKTYYGSTWVPIEQSIIEPQIQYKEIIDHKIVTYNNKKYFVGKITKTDTDHLFVTNCVFKDNIIYNQWLLGGTGYICVYVYIDGTRHTLQLHNYVMGKYTFDGQGQPYVYDHINRIPTDNRKENLRFYSTTENVSNLTKRKRSIELPENCGIKPEEIPTGVWFSKERLIKGIKHGAHFTVEIKEDSDEIAGWRSASTIELSLKFKLEQTKKYLRLLKESKPEIFKKHNIEYELNEEAIKLAKEYNEIIKLSGYNCVKDNLVKINDYNYLKEDLTGLTEQEIELLNKFTLEMKNKTKRNIISQLPKDCGITVDMIPKYCYYSPPMPKYRRHEGFVIDKHPKLKTRDWKTTMKKDVSLQDKFNQLIKKLEELEKS